MSYSSIVEKYALEAARAYGFTDTPVAQSGIIKTIDYIQSHYPEVFTQDELKLLPTQLPGIVGGYPHNTGLEKGIAGLMIVCMFGALCGNMWVLARNEGLNHRFYPSFGIVAHCLFAIAGWACRLAWAADLLNFRLLIVSYFLLLLTEYLLPAVNLCLAQRILAFQHPEHRQTLTYLWLMSITGFVSFVISAVGVCVPRIHYMTSGEWNSLGNLQLAGSIMGVIFHICPIGLVSFSFLIKPIDPSSKRAARKQFPALSQPYWIQNIGVFSAFRPLPIDSPAVGVIPSCRLPANGLNKLVTGPMNGGPPMYRSVLCVIPTALLLYSAALIRSLATGFAVSNHYPAEFIVSTNPVTTEVTWFPTGAAALWVFYGGLQTLAMIYWLLNRIDLRFYVPQTNKKFSNSADKLCQLSENSNKGN